MEIRVTGSEKQVAWATEIIKKMEPGFEWIRENVKPEQKEYFEKVIESIVSAKAYKVIRAYKDSSFIGTPFDVAKEVLNCYKAHNKMAIPEDRF